jgi:dTDP-4-amino-4,6-dideoxygalactose transaminase
VELAIFSGTPRFPNPVHVGAPAVEPAVRQRFHALMDEAFDRNHLTNDGPFVRRLEEEIARLHDVRHCVALANATLAQILLLKAMGLESGEVIVPSFTFVATAHACLWQGLRPVFADVEPETLTLDPADCARRVTSRTVGLVATHIFGNLADTEALARFSHTRGIFPAFDAAHAFDCDRGGVRPGGFDAPEFLSFHATKAFGTFEGGAVLTRDGALAERLRHLRNFGFRGFDDVTWLGINAKMCEAAAAMGLASLPDFPARRERFAAAHAGYAATFAGVPGLRILPVGTRGRTNYRYFAMFVEEAEFGLSRDALYEALWRENVLARRYFHPGCHRMAFYRERNAPPSPPLAVTEAACERILCLPTGMDDPEVSARQIGELVHVIRDQAPRVRAWHAKQSAGSA